MSSLPPLRYIRKRLSAPQISAADIHPEAKEVEWLSDWKPGNFFSLPSEVPLSTHPLYVEGIIFGIDAASCAAVRALDIERNSLCLDLCCAPGGKTLLIAELTEGGVVGVDISKERLLTTRSIMKRWKNENKLILVREDGRFFNPTHALSFEEEASLAGKRSRLAWKRRKANSISKVSELMGERTLFDRVLVDAECTHDGSLRHVAKQEGKMFKMSKEEHQSSSSFKEFRSPWTDRESELFDLQLGLLKNGYKNLQIGGVLVYSTCSGNSAQNENIIRAFLKQSTDANDCFPQLEPLPFNLESCKATEIKIDSEKIPCACFFDPQITQTGGLFICRLRKQRID